MRIGTAESSLKKAVISALGWAAGAKLGSQIIAWIVTIYVIRLLSPQDYGLMAMAMIVSNLLVLINPIGAALIQTPDLDESKLAYIFGLAIVVDVVLALLLVLIAPMVGQFFENPGLPLIVRVIALQFVVMPFVQIPSAMLERNLALKQTGIVQMTAQLCGSGATLILAATGLGVWALVWGAIAVEVARAVGYQFAGIRLPWPRLSISKIRSVVAFGGRVSAERLFWFWFSQADILIVGKILGEKMLGVFAVGNQLATLIMHKTGETLYVVALPTFAKLQNDPTRVRDAVNGAHSIMALITFPIFFGLASVSKEFVDLILGERWEQVTLILMLLCVSMPFRMLGNLLPPMLQGVGAPGRSARNIGISATLMTLAFLIGVNWGIVGVAASWAVVYPVVYFVILSNACSTLNASILELATVILRPALCGVLMVGVVAGVNSQLDHWSVSDALQLPVLIGTGVGSYFVLIALLNRPAVDNLRGVLRRKGA